MTTLLATTLRAQQIRRYRSRGITVAVVSGVFYGLYSAFISLAMATGGWSDWAAGAAVSAFAAVYLLGILAAGLNDLLSGVWALVIGGARGKFRDTLRVARTRPGRVLMACAIIGGPIGTVAYILALQLGGAAIIPITALCPAFGAILSRILFKQPLRPIMIVGIAVCLGATCLIAYSAGSAPGSDVILGLVLAFVAALAWAVEGAVAGMGTAVVDYEIAITIRQWTSGLITLFIVLPAVALIGGELGTATEMIGLTLSSPMTLLVVAVSGLFALYAFGLWYRGNGMCGTALGMACNGTYSFWGPLFCWLLLGVSFGMAGWGIAPIAWVGAVLMSVGILLVATNPLEWLRAARARVPGGVA
ncbi:DMT family transporter [Xylanimonas ulmi]|uniref:EamA domain-containing protein n=1 Tax=Xylanimonas ulmi TaxID=228973 RepID=A0A4Q7LYM7_9MICO|nr:DMT family transporter [Xylanibacterium ulmi]RZS59964.1 hypothetical protein EV386_0204 [Xylanibacterium ulmi]